MRRIQMREKLPNPNPDCPAAVYSIMLDCWKLDPAARCTATTIHARLLESAQQMHMNAAELVWPSNHSDLSFSRTPSQHTLTSTSLDLDAPACIAAFDMLRVEPGRLRLGRTLGEGQFGMVSAAVLTTGTASTVDVAVKVLKDDVTPDMQAKFLLEARILAALNHAHIVRVLAVCFDSTPHMIVVEFMSGGDLQSYLQKHCDEQKTEAKALIEVLVQIASAMTLLERYRVVHRDIAARYACVYVFSM